MKMVKKVDPAEFGLEEKQVATIEQAFAPKVAEREGFSVMYKQLLTKEINKSVCNEARDLRLKLVKVRTGISDIHRTQKAFFLAAGKFVDAWKNKETEPVTQMEENLVDIEKYYENQEKERIAKLAAVREAEIRKYSEVIPYDLGNMDATVYETYLVGVKVAMESRIKAEKEAEKERKRKEKAEKEKARLQKIEDKRIREENERLKKEADEKEKQAKLEAEKRAKEEQERKAKEAEERKKWEERDRIERETRAKLEAELKAKKDAEIAAQKAKEAEELKAKQEAEELAKAPRRDKLNAWIDDLTISIPFGTKDDKVVIEIVEKFHSFKKWAKTQVEKV